MSMTPAEEKRLIAAEQAINALTRMMNGVGSTDQLNRLYIIYDRELNRIEKKIEELEERASEILELARKVQ